MEEEEARRWCGSRRSAWQSSAQRPAVADNERRMTPPAIRLAARQPTRRGGERASCSERVAKMLRKRMFLQTPNPELKDKIRQNVLFFKFLSLPKNVNVSFSTKCSSETTNNPPS